MSKRRAPGTILGDCFGQARLQEQECPECHGKRTMPSISGNGHLRCPRCRGTGRAQTPNAGQEAGKGEIAAQNASKLA